MGHDFFTGFSKMINGKGDMFKKDSKSDAGTHLLAKAQGLGINVGKFCSYDEEGNIESIDTAGLNAAIAQATQEQNAMNSGQADAFDRSSKDAELTTDEKTKAKNYKNEVDTEYNDALLEYANSFNTEADSVTDEGRLQDKWEDIEEKSLKYIGVDASDTTVLEGAKEFISKIYGLVNETKNTVEREERENEIAGKTEEEIALEENNIEVYSTSEEDNTNPFADIYFKSAMNIFNEEEREEAVA